MRSVVLDTMVLVSGFTSGAGTSGWLVDRWREQTFRLIVSEHMLAEFSRALRDDCYFRARVSPDQVNRFLAVLRDEADMTRLHVPVVGVATQPKDDLILSTALSGGASHLATRDRQLLRIERYQELVIVSPGELRRLIEDGFPAS